MAEIPFFDLSKFIKILDASLNMCDYVCVFQKYFTLGSRTKERIQLL